MILRICPDCHQPTRTVSRRGRCPRCTSRNERQHRATPSWQAHNTTRHRRLRHYVLIRDGGRCNHCRTTKDLTLDYIRPLSQGGTMTADNAQCLCRSCNSRKANAAKR